MHYSEQYSGGEDDSVFYVERYNFSPAEVP